MINRLIDRRETQKESTIKTLWHSLTRAKLLIAVVISLTLISACNSTGAPSVTLRINKDAADSKRRLPCYLCPGH